MKIQLRPDRAGLLQTRIIDGVPYVMIRAQDGVEVNGVEIQIPNHGTHE